MNRIEISKDLLSEVLGDDYNDRLVDWFQIEDNYLKTYYDCGRYDYKGRPTGLGIEINIYELAHKCKEWTMNKEYQIISGLSDEPAHRKQDEKAYAKVLWYEGDDVHREYKDMYFMANTEVEAVIKASEYIFKAISNK